MVRTGDAGYYDKNGFIYVIGRIKDLIKYKGTLVRPSEVEAVMRAHPGIDDCAVVGRQDHVAGEVPAAFGRGQTACCRCNFVLLDYIFMLDIF